MEFSEYFQIKMSSLRREKSLFQPFMNMPKVCRVHMWRLTTLQFVSKCLSTGLKLKFSVFSRTEFSSRKTYTEYVRYMRVPPFNLSHHIVWISFFWNHYFYALYNILTIRHLCSPEWFRAFRGKYLDQCLYCGKTLSVDFQYEACFPGDCDQKCV